MEQLCKKKQCTNFLNGIFRHYAFPIKSLKLIQIEPIEHPKRIQVEPIRIFSQTYTFYPSSANQNILLTNCRGTFQDADFEWASMSSVVSPLIVMIYELRPGNFYLLFDSSASPYA